MAKKLVLDIGINDARYAVKTYNNLPKNNGKQVQKLKWTCPYYKAWKNMLERCYSLKYKEIHPTYKDCSVCEDWLLFSNFKSWMEQQDWEGKQLDKDLLVYGNKVYSPDTCVFISNEINSFITLSNKNDQYPIGVDFHKASQKFRARCSDSGEKYLGIFCRPEDAHKAWQEHKIMRASNLISKYKDNPVITQKLESIKFKIQNDLCVNKETTYF